MREKSPIQQLRKEKNLSLRDIAGQIDVSPQHLSAVENGRDRLTLRVASLLADVLEEDVDEIFAWHIAWFFQKLLRQIRDSEGSLDPNKVPANNDPITMSYRLLEKLREASEVKKFRLEAKREITEALEMASEYLQQIEAGLSETRDRLSEDLTGQREFDSLIPKPAQLEVSKMIKGE